MIESIYYPRAGDTVRHKNSGAVGTVEGFEINRASYMKKSPWTVLVRHAYSDDVIYTEYYSEVLEKISNLETKINHE